MKKLNSKGFTLVELLAVIIILAIVVGITIPAVLTTINTTRDKAFQTAADSAADWFEREYQAYQVGDDTIVKVDPSFKDVCVTNNCTTSKRTLTAAAIKAAGLKSADISAANSSVSINPTTGRACVVLSGSANGSYQTSGSKKGGIC